jgi:hypothetical protein
MRRKRKILPFRLFRILLDSETGEFAGGGGGTTTTTPVETATPVTEPSTDTSAQLGSDTPADPGGTPTVDPTTTTPAAGATPGNDWQSIREAARAYGYDPGQQFGDDRQFLIHLLQQAQNNRQADFYARLGQQIAPHAQQFQTYLQQQQAPAQPQGPQPWEAPEFDERWVNLVDRDPATGVFLAKPGVPAEIAQKVNAYADWKAKFDRNPAQVINGMVEQRAKAIAADVVREQLQAQTREQTIGQIVAENRSWIYQLDAQGAPTINPMTGQPVVTPTGARYLHHLQAVRSMGVTDPRHQDSLAKNLVRAEFAAAQQAGNQAAATQAANPQTRQAATMPNLNPLQAQPPAQRRTNPAATEPSPAGKSLRELLQEDFAAEGVTDADFAPVGT